MSNAITRFVDSLWRLFVSLKLTFVLLVIISVGAIIGMCFDQTLGYEEFFKSTGTEGLKKDLFIFFEVFDAFHSWWFSLAIFFLAANLIACSIEKLPRIYLDGKRPRPYLSDRRLLGLSLKKVISVKSESDAERAIRTFFAGLKFFNTFNHNGKRYYFGKKVDIARYGVYVVHTALLVIMFSSIYATQRGIDGHLVLEEGQQSRFVSARGLGGIRYKYDLGFYIGCDDFRLKTFVDNSPMEFESDLHVANAKGLPIAYKTVRVNEPLSYAGFTFYQASYQPIISEKIVLLKITEGDSKNLYRLKLNESLLLKSGASIMVTKIYEDFAGLGQAIRIVEKPAMGFAETYFHIFRRYPDFDQEVRQANYSAIFVDVDQTYKTGLSVGFVPGISVIFSGFLLLLVGLYMCFFLVPIRLLARVEQGEGLQWKVYLAAQGIGRHQQSVKQYFHERYDEVIKILGE